MIIRHVCIERKKSAVDKRERKGITDIILSPLLCAPIRGEQNRIKMFDDWWEIMRVFRLLSRFISVAAVEQDK